MVNNSLEVTVKLESCLSFKLGERVKITELEAIGRIKSIWIGDRGVRWEVRYFHNGKAEEIYFYEDEIEKTAD